MNKEEYLRYLEYILENGETPDGATITTKMRIDMQQLMDKDPWLNETFTKEETEILEQAEQESFE